MSANLEVYVWVVSCKNRNNSGNRHIVGIDQVIMSQTERFKCFYQFGVLIPQAQQVCSEDFPPFL